MEEREGREEARVYHDEEPHDTDNDVTHEVSRFLFALVFSDVQNDKTKLQEIAIGPLLYKFHFLRQR